MDDRLHSLDWTLLRAFHATAAEGSLSAAARRLRLTQPTLSRQVAALEDQLSVMLFERVGRRLELTDAGRQILGHVEEMGAAAERVALAASGQRSEIGGTVRITATDTMSAFTLPPVVAELAGIAPQLRIEIVAVNDISNLLRREADIAIRHQRPTEPDLVARLVREAQGHFYASKAYLARRGRPASLAEMARHDWVGFGDHARFIDYMVALGIPLAESAIRTASENSTVAWELARAGLGICAMDSRFADRFADMEAVLRAEASVSFPVWLVAHREVHTSPRIRLVFDLLAARLGDAPHRKEMTAETGAT